MSRFRPRVPLARAISMLTAALACAGAAAAQQYQIIGSLAGRTTNQALAKGNCLRIDRTVILDEFAYYLELAEPQSLVFTLHRAVAEDAEYALERSWKISAEPAGSTWYSPGATYVPLLAGNHYILSVSWSGTATYSFHPAAAWPLAFGDQRYAFWNGTHPLGPHVAARNEMPATYLMSFTTHEPTPFDPSTRLVGQGCAPSGASIPRLACAEMPLLGNENFALEVATGVVGKPTWLGITPFPAPQPIALGAGCELYLDPRGVWFSVGPVLADANAVARFPIAIPYEPTISGVEVPLQASTFDLASGAIDFSNALFLLYR